MDYIKRMMGQIEDERRSRTNIEKQWFEVLPLLKEMDNELENLLDMARNFEVLDKDALTYVPNVEVIREFLKDVMFLGTHASNILGELEGDLPYED